MASHISEKLISTKEEVVSTPAAEDHKGADIVASASSLVKNLTKATGVESLALVNKSDSPTCLQHGTVMALSPISLDHEQLPLERFLAEGAAEQCSIFGFDGFDGAVILSTHGMCTCKTVGPELELGHDSEGEDGASKVGVLILEDKCVE
ncbi:hypothetical protein E2P81_ATG03029 [Venturia nashicola]|nr:hypothetical protein E2P81_ATG03029 [Venturia nashicola]